ncbi:MAG: D-alanine--D-alanine ligase [Bacteroidales bacterium]|jgi:D-alanine-D-alanine ligase|nr:D-alanine--D-alanine ligase [Bacteroidales bacterium]
MNKKNIAILGGGYSSEAEISKNSTHQLCEMMDTNAYSLYPIFIEKDSWYALYEGVKYPVHKDNFTISIDNSVIFFDCIYNSIHGTPGEDGHLSAYFELLNMPYTNSDVFSSALTFNKYATKTFLNSFGIKSAKGVLIVEGAEINEEHILSELGLPCFVKPNNGGSSFGISKVSTKEQLLPAIECALKEDTEVLIESFIEGVEISNGVYRIENTVHVLPITEIETTNDFFDYQAKYEGKSNEITPARLSNELTKICQDLTKQIYTLLQCKGICRIDYIVQNNTLYMLEINTIPGMSKASIIPQQIRAAGLKESDVFTAIIEHTIKEHNK